MDGPGTGLQVPEQGQEGTKIAVQMRGSLGQVMELMIIGSKQL